MNTYSAPDPFVGRVLDGRYRLDELIARGGMATVYQATDLRLVRTVAVKVLADSLATDPGFVDRFIHEARATAALMHPNVVAVHDQGVAENYPYLVMEFVPGRTLREVLRETGPMPSAHALEIMRAVLAGLGAAHDAGFVHRDVKPENVLITNDGHVKVTDFGIARVISDTPASDSTGSVILGTMAYVSPEAVQQQTIDQRTDVYSAGVLLFELVTGRVPFTGASPLDVAYRHVNEDIPSPSSIQPDVPPAIDHLVLAATRRNRNDRLQTAREFQDGVIRAQRAVPAAEALTTALPANSTLIIDNPGRGAHRATGATNTNTRSRSQSTTGIHRSRKSATQRKRRVAIVAAAVAAVGFGWYQFTGSYANMPNVVGQSVEQAQQVLTPLELSTETTEAFSEDIAVGTIISTEPSAGGKARKGRAVTLIVSKGQERYLIPSNLEGMDPTGAKKSLEDLTLVVVATKAVYSDTVKKGLVADSSPKAGEKVKRGAEVTLLVSKGPKPVTIPALLGKDYVTIKATMDKLGLKLDVTDEIFDDSVSGTILSADPLPGVVVDKGSTIKIVLSKGPALVSVPNVVGKDRKAATKILTDAGFKVSIKKQISVVVLNKVYSQSPAGGQMAPKGSTIVLKIV